MILKPSGYSVIEQFRTDPDVLKRLERVEKLIDYLILKETDPEKATLIIAEFYGTKEIYTEGT